MKESSIGTKLYCFHIVYGCVYITVAELSSHCRDCIAHVAAITEYCPRGGLNNINLFSHSSGG